MNEMGSMDRSKNVLQKGCTTTEKFNFVFVKKAHVRMLIEMLRESRKFSGAISLEISKNVFDGTVQSTGPF